MEFESDVHVYRPSNIHNNGSSKCWICRLVNLAKEEFGIVLAGDACIRFAQWAGVRKWQLEQLPLLVWPQCQQQSFQSLERESGNFA